MGDSAKIEVFNAPKKTTKRSWAKPETINGTFPFITHGSMKYQAKPVKNLVSAQTHQSEELDNDLQRGSTPPALPPHNFSAPLSPQDRMGHNLVSLARWSSRCLRSNDGTDRQSEVRCPPGMVAEFGVTRVTSEQRKMLNAKNSRSTLLVC